MSGGRGGVWTQLPTFDSESKSAKIQNSLCRGGGVQTQLKIFHSEPKSAKIRNSLCWWGLGEGGDHHYVTHVRHLVRIWGELQHFDNKIFHQARATASQIVSYKCATFSQFCVKIPRSEETFRLAPELSLELIIITNTITLHN